MPKTKTQGIVFGLIMSYTMAIGMEVYNTAVTAGLLGAPGGFTNLTPEIFVSAFQESLLMVLFVILYSEWFGNRMGAAFVERHSTPDDNPYFRQLLRQAGTVAVMCPVMSLTASVLFTVILGGVSWTMLPIVWFGTLMKNLPMAFFWNMFAAAPFTHWVFGLIFERGENKAAVNIQSKKAETVSAE